MATLNFDATQYDPNVGNYDPLPAGDYTAMVEATEMKPTQAGNGYYLALTWEICEGEHQGRKIWQNITIQNPSQKAEEIGARQLSNVCHAVGILQCNESEELHGRPCLITLKFVPPNGNYGAKNEVVKCSPLNGQLPPRPAPAAQTPRPAAVASAPAPQARVAAAPPWKR